MGKQYGLPAKNVASGFWRTAAVLCTAEILVNHLRH